MESKENFSITIIGVMNYNNQLCWIVVKLVNGSCREELISSPISFPTEKCLVSFLSDVGRRRYCPSARQCHRVNVVSDVLLDVV